jgi:hypothetical protein
MVELTSTSASNGTRNWYLYWYRCISSVDVFINEFSPPEPFLRFAQRTCPIHYFRSKTHVWGGFTQFRCCTSPIPKTGVGVHTSTRVRHRNHFFVFRNEHAQSTTLGPKLMFGVVSHNFVAARHQFRKWVSGCIQSTSFCHRNHYVVFLQRTCPIHYFSSKTHVWVVSRKFVASRHPFRKRVSGCIQSTSYCHRNHFFVFRNEHAQSDEDINTNTSTSTPAAPSPAQAPSSPVQAPPLPPGPVTRARARELNYIMLLKNEGPEE